MQLSDTQKPPQQLQAENNTLRQRVAELEAQLGQGSANATNQRQVEQSLQRRIQLKQMLAETSTRFMNLTFEQADAELQRTLAELGQFVKADRCHIYSVTTANAHAKCTHEWCAPGVPTILSRLQNIQSDMLPLLNQSLLANQVLHIRNVLDLPASSSKDRLLATGVKSFIAIPLFAKNQVQGAITITVTTRQPEQPLRNEDLVEFKLLGEIVASAQQRWQMESNLQLANQRLEKRVAERTADLYDLYNNAPCGYHALDSTGRFIHINDTELHWLGYPREALIGQHVTKILPEDQQHIFRDSFAELMAAPSDHIIEAEVDFLCRDGRRLPIALNIAAVRDANGNFVMSRSTSFDLTERKHSMEALRRSDARLNYLLTETPALVYSIRVGSENISEVTYCSQSIRTVLGYEPEQVFNNPGFLEANIHPDDVMPSKEFFNEMLSSNEAILQFRFRHADGQYRWLSCGLRLVHVAPGSEPEVIGYAVDITDQKNAEAQLQFQRDYARQVMESINEGLVVADNAGRIEYINPYIERLFNRPLNDVVGLMINEFILPNTQPLIEMQRQIRMQGMRGQYEIDILDSDHRSRHMLVNASPRWQAGQVTGVIATMTDLTEREKIEAQLRQSRDNLSAANFALERAARMKDEFLASMSHELRTPLTAILGLSEGLLESILGPLNQKQRDAMTTIEASGRHLLNLINDLLDLSKIEAGVMDLVSTQFSVNAVCNTSLQFIKELAAKKRIKTFLMIESSIETMVADERRLKQMLVNLLTNAVKFTPDNGRVGLEVSGDSENNVIHFAIWDTGIGIAAKDIDKLFQPFVQLDNSLSRQYNGTGLGLSLVSRMAELHGGSIAVESTPGKGSRFTLSLPWINEQVEDEAHQIEDTSVNHLFTQLSNTKVLIVEDQVSDAARLSHLLTELNVQSVILPTGENIVSHAIDNRVDVILLDLLLPDHNGWDVLKSLKADPGTADIPVIILSVLDDRLHGLVEGALDCLVKPVNREQLQLALAQALKKSSDALRDGSTPGANATPPIRHTVLLVEDNEANIQTINAYLEAKGYDVLVARNGAEGLTLARSNRPDLILMDIQMPVLDGIEATRQLRLDPDPQVANIPIIALTALAMPGDRSRLLSVGANEYLAKPVNLKHLVALIESRLHTNATAKSTH